jgi:hypothetical protein
MPTCECNNCTTTQTVSCGGSSTNKSKSTLERLGPHDQAVPDCACQFCVSSGDASGDAELLPGHVEQARELLVLRLHRSPERPFSTAGLVESDSWVSLNTTYIHVMWAKQYMPLFFFLVEFVSKQKEVRNPTVHSNRHRWSKGFTR